MSLTEVAPQIQSTPAPPLPQGAMAQPTRKYTDYLAELQAGLQGKLSKRERRRLEYLSSLMQRARFINLNGIVHHYQEVGPPDGEPVILVHGWDCSALWWHHIVDDLANAGYRMIIYDLKGHGFSDPDPNNGYTVQGFSDDLKALGEALNIPSYHLISFSLGSAISLHHAAQFSDCVRSLIFFNFGILSDNRFQVAVVVQLLDFVFNKVLRPIERLGLWVIPYVYARLVLAKNTPLVSDAKLGTLGLRWCHPDAVRISAQQLADPEIQKAIPRQMAQVTQPTLLVAGESDPVMVPKNGRKLIDLAPNGTYLEVPRCGHIILFELPGLVVQIVRMHLRSVQGSTA